MENQERPTPTPEEDLAAYQKLRQRVSKLFGELNEKINPETITRTLDKAAAELKEMGEYSKEAIAKAHQALTKDIASTTDQLRPKLNEAKKEARKFIERGMDKGGELWREINLEAERLKEFSLDKGGMFLLNMTNGLNEWSREVSEKLATSLTYKSGELTHGGEFCCLQCGDKVRLKKPGHIPPCPKCRHPEFRRC